MLSLQVFATVKDATEGKYKCLCPQSSTGGLISTLGGEASKELDFIISDFFLRLTLVLF
jgi:hypothetical protein